MICPRCGILVMMSNERWSSLSDGKRIIVTKLRRLQQLLQQWYEVVHTRRFACRAVPPATLVHKEEWNRTTDVVVDVPTFYVQTGDLQMPRAPCSGKTLAHMEEWNWMTDVVDGPTFQVQTGDLQITRAPCSRKTTRTPHACTYILVFVYILWSAHTWFAALCRGDCAALCGAVLCSRYCCRYSTTKYSYILQQNGIKKREKKRQEHH